jgi:hypothetical protein
MAESQKIAAQPPSLTISDGAPSVSSLADLVEWFIANDERTSRVRHPYANELFEWKQKDDEAQGLATYPFENAEARFAIGTIQAVNENNSEPLLKLWITDVLDALHQAREMKAELTDAYQLDADPEAFALKKSEKLPTGIEKRLYLTNCWYEILYTAEARVLGYVYQEVYGRPFAP